jgi:hypothetical protein
MSKADRLLGQIAGMAVTAMIVTATNWPIVVSTGVGILAGALTVLVITNLILRDRV